ncbi:hypothetical protein H5410_035551 [Solanum commersonii]|uniref:Uncharacterized protein n=2 Tax=Solanum TaxID=4107 RepID=M1CSY4_SOLTU|nr:PREDICTED: uncharacterized protein LOC107063476 [Solanum tuberosum]KAG5594319.1 hypothetical protein H5410_035551 [Solanum commersonii]KAH0649977.1 hypothetical protein KY284_029889 [Solanum tuberosum]
MYCCFSFNIGHSDKLKIIRVVHLNGYVEDFDHPISVSEVMGKTKKHFIFTQSQLLSTCLQPLNLDYMLQQGNIYFLLPHSTFQSCVSPIDLAPIAKRLSGIAKKPMAYNKDKPRKKKSSNGTTSQRVWNSPTSSPNRFSDEGKWVDPEKGRLITYGMGQRMSTKSPKWEPLLDTIRERSFNRRSESDLQEKNLEGVKFI